MSFSDEAREVFAKAEFPNAMTSTDSERQLIHKWFGGESTGFIADSSYELVLEMARAAERRRGNTNPLSTDSEQFEKVVRDVATYNGVIRPGSGVQPLINEYEQRRIIEAHQAAVSKAVESAALATICPQCGATEAWHILNPDNHRSQAINAQREMRS